MREYFATCPRHIEPLLLKELAGLGIVAPRQTTAGVYFNAHLEQVYEVCLWTRLASRVLMPLARVQVESIEQIYNVTHAISWEDYFSDTATFVVDFNGTNNIIRNSQFGAQKIKDALVDRFQQRVQNRPSIDKSFPDVRINAHLSKNILSVSIDLSGESLHRRGYRQKQGEAPLKENLAAALLVRAHWPTMLHDAESLKNGDGIALIDPMCGSGTLLIEAALMAAQIAPGLLRRKFGFQSLAIHNEELWQKVFQEAKVKASKKEKEKLPVIEGFDSDPNAVARANENIEAAGLRNWVSASVGVLENFQKCQTRNVNKGLLICNPPLWRATG